MTNKTRGKTAETVLADLVPRLEKTSETASLDAQLLLARLLEKPRAWVAAHPEASLTGKQAAALEAMAARLEAGEPLPYLLGRWEFFGLELEVTPDVLIPRPETELLVEQAIAWLTKRKVENREQRVMDVGTGSGCIAIALAVNVPGAHVAAVDISPAALAVARRNAALHGVADRIEFYCCDLLPEDGLLDLIVANLPYIPTSTLHGLPVYGREPTLALDGGADGLDQIRRLLGQVPERLAPGGLLLMEIEASEGPAAVSLACDVFAEAEIHLHKDLSGRERVLEVQV